MRIRFDLLDVILVITGIVFVVLKLTGHIDWSWWLVLLPLYVTLALSLAMVVLLGTMGGLATLIALPFARGEDRRNAKRKDEWAVRDARYAQQQASKK